VGFARYDNTAQRHNHYSAKLIVLISRLTVTFLGFASVVTVIGLFLGLPVTYVYNGLFALLGLSLGTSFQDMVA